MRPSSPGFGGFEHAHRTAGAGEGDGGSGPVEPLPFTDPGSCDPQRELVEHREPLDPLRYPDVQ